MSSDRPTLWHIPVSHYSEKVRWALDRKGIEYGLKAPPPGVHMGFALALTRGAHKTFPVLQLDGRTIGDSSAIIAALEGLEPSPALIPDDPGERSRALELEEFFDEELGPHVRLLAFHELRNDPVALREFTSKVMPAPVAGSSLGLAVGSRLGSAYSQLRYRVAGPEEAEIARSKILAAFDRLDAELAMGDGRRLVGESFSVADITAASMFMPFVQPPEGPNRINLPEPLQRFREPLEERPGFRWVLETYARDRRGLPAA